MHLFAYTTEFLESKKLKNKSLTKQQCLTVKNCNQNCIFASTTKTSKLAIYIFLLTDNSSAMTSYVCTKLDD